jgi:hypothetical protein
MAQVVEVFPCKHKTPSSNPSTARGKGAQKPPSVGPFQSLVWEMDMNEHQQMSCSENAVAAVLKETEVLLNYRVATP